MKPSILVTRFNVNYSSEEFLLERAHKTDAGFHIKANVTQDVIIEPGEFKVIDTGIRLELRPRVEAQVRSRSGLAAKCGVAILNSPGTVDPGYRGEVKVIFINHGKEPFKISKGDKIEQIVFSRLLDIEVFKIESLHTKVTDRGEGGFGSTDTGSPPGARKK